MDDRPKRAVNHVVCITGMGRSGSTLLGQMLGALPGFVSVGEFYTLWTVARHGGTICGCGAPFGECPFWSAVLADAYGDDVAEGLDELARSFRGVARRRYVPLLLWPRSQGATFRARVRRYGDAIRPLLRALRASTDAEVLVDSSSQPVYALAWKQLPEIRVSLVHLVRDPRAVASSFARHRRNPTFQHDDVFMPRLSASRAALLWDVRNTLAELARSRRAQYIRIRYEDYVADPRGAIGSVLDLVSDRPLPLDFLGSGLVELPVSHTIAGNPMRFDAGRVELSLDNGWREELPRRSAITATVLTLPLMYRYGYRVAPDATTGRSTR